MESNSQTESVKVCRVEDITDGTVSLFTVKRRKIAITRIGEEVFALLDACPHKGGSLSAGAVSVKRRELICPLHFFRYCLATGTSATNPDLSVQTFPVKVDPEGSVFVDITRPKRKGRA